MTNQPVAHRTTREVLDDHLQLAKDGDLETDLARNYSPDIVVLFDGIYRGLDEIRALAYRLNDELPGGAFQYTNVLTEGEFGFLAWTGTSPTSRIHDGADSYVIRNGRILYQSIHYTVESL